MSLGQARMVCPEYPEYPVVPLGRARMAFHGRASSRPDRIALYVRAAPNRSAETSAWKLPRGNFRVETSAPNRSALLAPPLSHRARASRVLSCGCAVCSEPELHIGRSVAASVVALDRKAGDARRSLALVPATCFRSAIAGERRANSTLRGASVLHLPRRFCSAPAVGTCSQPERDAPHLVVACACRTANAPSLPGY